MMSWSSFIKMAVCIADVEFLFNQDGEAFPKKVIIAGVRNKRPLICEIDYKIPTLSEKLENDNAILQGKSLKYEFGFLYIKEYNDELRSTLNLFDIIITKTKQQRDFLKRFSNSKIFLVEE